MISEQKLIEEFWFDSEDLNFSKEAAILFFFLIRTKRERGSDEIKINPMKVGTFIKGFTPANCIAASEELEKRGYIKFTAPIENATSGTYRIIKEGVEVVKRNRTKTIPIEKKL